MRLPFVSRAAYESMVTVFADRITELKAQLAKVEAKAEEEHQRFVDILSVRAIGLSIYGKIHPPQEEKEQEEIEPKRGDPDQPEPPHVPSRIEQAIEERGTKARGLVKRVEAENLVRHQESVKEVERIYALAREAGQERAEARAEAANGNH